MKKKPLIIKRQEEKFCIGFNELNFILKKFNAFPSYPPRKVCSLYFDTNTLEHYHSSEEGLIPRKKIRIRWYGNELYNLNKKNFNAAIECKNTFEHYRTKQVDIHSFKSYKDLLNFQFDKSDKYLIPVCMVLYDRLYYENIEGLRFTYDFNIQCLNYNFSKKSFINNTIFEIKYNSDAPDPQFNNLLGDQRTRFSKYNEAVNTIIIN